MEQRRSADPSFGVTSAIGLSDLSAKTGAVLASTTINPSIVSTSFSSKSELGLNLTKTSTGYVATFMGYAGGGVGNLDVSNSDTTAYKDTTNPVTSFFAPGANQTYAFNRSVVAFNANGSYTATQTLAYGGNNGRSAVLAPNGLYYTVGNSNNGSGTPTQLTTTTGLEVATPGSTPNSTMIDPTFKATSRRQGGQEQQFPRADLLQRQPLFHQRQRQQRHRHGLHRQQSKRPASDLGDRVDATISILPGFPTDSAKRRAGLHSVRPLLRQPDDALCRRRGHGQCDGSTDHAGLEKWTLSNGTWSLDYTLQAGLIGDTYSVPGWDFGETTIGLRNLTGEVNANGTVTFWATTSTSSDSGDNGADPNEIVEITDALGETSLPTSESFSVFDGPEAGTSLWRRRLRRARTLDVGDAAAWLRRPRLRGLSKALGSFSRLISRSLAR